MYTIYVYIDRLYIDIFWSCIHIYLHCNTLCVYIYIYIYIFRYHVNPLPCLELELSNFFRYVVRKSADQLRQDAKVGAIMGSIDGGMAKSGNVAHYHGF